jgi:hypothetical protein
MRRAMAASLGACGFVVYHKLSGKVPDPDRFVSRRRILLRLTLESSEVSSDAIGLVAQELEARGVHSTLFPNGVKSSLLDEHTAFTSFDVSIPTEEALTALSSVLAKTSQSASIKIKIDGVECLATGQEAIHKAICKSIYLSCGPGTTCDEISMTEQELREIETGGRTLNSLLDSIDAV